MATKQARRTFLIAVLGICIWILLVGKLFSIQILQNDEYRQRGKDQHQRRLILSAQRGEIYDRDGVKLVFNLPVKSYHRQFEAKILLRLVSQKNGARGEWPY